MKAVEQLQGLMIHWRDLYGYEWTNLRVSPRTLRALSIETDEFPGFVDETRVEILTKHARAGDLTFCGVNLRLKELDS